MIESLSRFFKANSGIYFNFNPAKISYFELKVALESVCTFVFFKLL
jgi:hypothetical protein